MERLESLQTLLGTGWWEMFSDRDEVQLAPSLPHAEPDSGESAEDWLALIHPADREELRSRCTPCNCTAKP
jgi:hypothetical protein